MNAARKRRLEAGGWCVGTVAEFLGLTPEESEFIEIKLALVLAIRRWRARRHWSRARLAKKLRCSPAVVARMEIGRASVEALLEAMLALGATRRNISRVLISGA
jgi:predicted XRE-type DNA-binding protein